MRSSRLCSSEPLGSVTAGCPFFSESGIWQLFSMAAGKPRGDAFETYEKWRRCPTG